MVQLRIPYRIQKLVWKFFPYRAKQFASRRSSFINKSGLEIGGSSSYFEFRGSLPVYTLAKALDNVVVAPPSVGAAVPLQGYNFQVGNVEEPGYQFVQEASLLPFIEEESYEFLISSHVLEHIANPLKAILEWKRVLKPESISLHLIPIPENCFDHKRPVTEFEHLLEDYQFNRGEEDLTHLEEVLELHDHSRNSCDMTEEDFVSWCSNNHEHRIMHHHVFNQELLTKCFEWAGYQDIHVEELDPVSYIVIAKT